MSKLSSIALIIGLVITVISSVQISFAEITHVPIMDDSSKNKIIWIVDYDTNTDFTERAKLYLKYFGLYPLESNDTVQFLSNVDDASGINPDTPEEIMIYFIKEKLTKSGLDHWRDYWIRTHDILRDRTSYDKEYVNDMYKIGTIILNNSNFTSATFDTISKPEKNAIPLPDTSISEHDLEIIVNPRNDTTRVGLPIKITLVNESDTNLKNVVYRLNIDNEKNLPISTLDKGEFDTAIPIGHDAIKFTTNSILPQDKNSGYVAFLVNKNDIKDQEITFDIVVSANDYYHATLTNIQAVGTNIELVITITGVGESGFELSSKYTRGNTIPCLKSNIEYIETNSLDDTVDYAVNVENCSSKSQKISFQTKFDETDIMTIFDPVKFDISPKSVETSNLRLQLLNPLPDGIYNFQVHEEVTTNIFGYDWKLYSNTADAVFEINGPHVVPEIPSYLLGTVTAFGFLFLMLVTKFKFSFARVLN